MTIIKNCECKHDFQDKEYGPKQRLMNLNDKLGATCTVCGSLHRINLTEKK